MAKSGPERATRPGSTILLRIRVGQKEPPRPGSTHFLPDESGPERANKTGEYDLLRLRVGQKDPPRSRECELLRIRMGQKEASKTRQFTYCYRPRMGQKEPLRRREYDLLRPRVGQKEPPSHSTICYGPEWARKSHQDPEVRFATGHKSRPERAAKTREYDFVAAKE